jgi:CHRD domain
MRTRIVGIAFVAGLFAVGIAMAGVNRNWSTHANGSLEVPARDTQGQAQAIFNMSKDGDAIDYKLIAANIDNVFMAHIHMAPPGVAGPIVVWLYPSTATTPGPVGGGRIDGVIAEGTITASNLVGPLKGQPLSALIDAMNSGNAYVNLHTNDGVAPVDTGPGDFPGGEVRGDLN